MDDKFDDALFDILKEAKTVPNFFDIVFGFLFRRTDFYHVSEDPNLGVGLPVGVAESYVRAAFMKYVNVREIINSPQIENEVILDENSLTVEREEVVEVCDKQCLFDGYNGAVYEDYSWSQSINDVDVQVKITEKLTAKQLSVNITSTNISIRLKNSDKIFLEGELCQKCKSQETIWSIDGCMLQIHLEKLHEMWWNCLVTSEEKLDVSKIDCSRPFHELSDEAQAKIEELKWNQERKRQGLPTSSQLKLEKTLKKAWNAEGSPFTGEYDPNKIILN